MPDSGYAGLGEGGYAQVAHKLGHECGGYVSPLIHVVLNAVEVILDGDPDLGRDARVRGEKGFHVEPVSLVLGNAARRGVRAGDVALLLQRGDLVAHGGGTYAEAMVSGKALGRDGRGVMNIVVDYVPEY